MSFYIIKCMLFFYFISTFINIILKYDKLIAIQTEKNIIKTKKILIIIN